MIKRLNKFFYSYYSVLLSGSLCLAVLFSLYTFFFNHMMIFPVFVCSITCLLLFAILLASIILIKLEGFKYTRLLALALLIINALYICFTLIVHVPLFDFFYYYANVLFYGFLIMSFLSAKRKPDYNTDFIIILGCSIKKNGGLLPILKSRTNRAIHYAWEQEIATGKNVLYVPSGGKGSDEIMSEGSAMEFYLLSHGAEEYEVFPEKDSKNTQENMMFSKQVIDGIMHNANIEFCTTNYHVFRSGIYAMRAGINAIGINSKTKWYFWPNALLREFAGFVTMFKSNHIVCTVLITLLFLIQYI